jgi:NAD(P)-dependent dehydrogenase (short-subunit alcohol dehydrogenase family)
MSASTAPAGLLAGKVAIVTGASMGIGEACAEYFAAAGASVVLAARSTAAIETIAARITSSGGIAACVATDVTDEESVAHLVATTIERFGRLDCAVNNAGMNPNTFTSIDEYPMDEFRAICDVKIYGVAYCVKHEIAAMKAAGRGGSIVNHSSLVAIEGTTGIYPAASASQAAVIGLTKAAAVSAAPFGIRVNALAIGAVATGTLGAMSKDEQAKYAANVPLGRMGTGADVAGAAAYLCSDMSTWITGVLLPVEGGHLA